MNDDIFFKPRNGDEMSHATDDVPIVKYSTLSEASDILGGGVVGVDRLLRKMFKKSLKWIVLLQDPKDENSGHWTSLSFNPKKDEVYFFSSYGGKPDFEKNKWISKEKQKLSHQARDVFNDGLKHLCEKGWVIHYNDHPYQFENDGTATCGIWTAAFLNSGMNPDQFYRYNLRKHMGVPEYFRKYFC